MRLLEKINRIEISELKNSQKQFDFIARHREYLEMLEDFSSFEFELLNRGRTIESVNQEIAFLKKMGS